MLGAEDAAANFDRSGELEADAAEPLDEEARISFAINFINANVPPPSMALGQ